VFSVACARRALELRQVFCCRSIGCGLFEFFGVGHCSRGNGWFVEALRGEMFKYHYIDFVIDMLIIKSWEGVIHPFMCSLELSFCCNNEHFVSCRCSLNIDAPWLLQNQVVDSGLIDIVVGIDRELDIQCFMLEVANWDGCDAL